MVNYSPLPAAAILIGFMFLVGWFIQDYKGDNKVAISLGVIAIIIWAIFLGNISP